MSSTVLFTFQDYWWLYAGFLAFVGAMLVLDLGVFHRKAHTVSFKEATLWSIFWVSLSMFCTFGFYLYAKSKFGPTEGSRLALEFLTGFVIEKALAVDNIFVFVMVFSAFGIPAIYQHRVLFLGILGAIFFRGAFIAVGAQLMAYHWVLVVFGVFLILTGFKMAFMHQKEMDPANSWQMRFMKRFFRVSSEIQGQKFFTVKNGVRYATPLFIALVFIELTDIIFAMDSVPAIFAITKEPMIVFISNILAIMGLRSLYFMLSGIIDRFVYIKYGLAAVLVFVGLKMVWLNDHFDGKFPIDWSLGVIAVCILGSIGASLYETR